MLWQLLWFFSYVYSNFLSPPATRGDYLRGRDKRAKALERLLRNVGTAGARTLEYWDFLKTAFWKDTAVGHEKTDAQKVLSVLRAMTAVDSSLDRGNGAALWMPPEVRDELKKEIYGKLRLLAYGQGSKSVRGRFVKRGRGRPKKGEDVGRIHWTRK